MHAGQSRSALSTLLRVFTLDPRHGEALSACAKLMTTFGDPQGAEHLKRLAADPEDPECLYQIGYHFINMGRPDVARSFLEVCLKLSGEHPSVMYELGYCNYKDRKFGRAADLIKKATQNLDPEFVTAAELLLVECLLYADRVDEGKELLEMARDEFCEAGESNSVEALELMYARHGRIDIPKPWDLRTWHYVQHGGILLAQSNKPNQHGIYEQVAMNELAVGGVLRLLASMIDGLKLPLDAVLHFNRESFILALAIGDLIKKPVRHWDQRANENEMLVVHDLHALAQTGLSPISREECAYLFCFKAFPLQEYNILPDLLGLLAVHFRFPWQERIEMVEKSQGEIQTRQIPEDTRNPELIAAELAEAARMLPDDSKAPGQVAFFKKQRELLVCCNQDLFQERRVFNPMSPA